jgi:hypothetical protein
MIIRTLPDHLQVCLQTDHAGLVGELASYFGAAPFSPVEPLSTVKLAADHHDDGWIEWEQEPCISPVTGQPFNFLNLPVESHIAIYRRAVQKALELHPYAALLVSLHGVGLYKKRYGFFPHLTFPPIPPESTALVNAFISEQEAIQAELRADLQPIEETLWTHYRWLQAWDMISVYICMKDPADGETYEIGVIPNSPHGPEHILTLSGVGSDTYTVRPWPFTQERIELDVPVRFVPSIRYPSDEAFRETFEASPTRRLPIILIK